MAPTPLRARAAPRRVRRRAPHSQQATSADVARLADQTRAPVLQRNETTRQNRDAHRSRGLAVPALSTTASSGSQSCSSSPASSVAPVAVGRGLNSLFHWFHSVPLAVDEPAWASVPSLDPASSAIARTRSSWVNHVLVLVRALATSQGSRPGLCGVHYLAVLGALG